MRFLNGFSFRNQIEDIHISINNLSISSNQENNKLENYNSILTNSINSVNTDLQNSKNLIGVSINTDDIKINLLGISSSLLDQNFRTEQIITGVSSGLLQSQINNLALLGLSGQNVDTQIAVSCAQMDFKLGQIIGISMVNTNTDINNLYTIANSLHTSGINTDQEFQIFKGDYIGITSVNIDNKLNLLSVSTSLLDNDINNLYTIANSLHTSGINTDQEFQTFKGAYIGISMVNVNNELNNLGSTCIHLDIINNEQQTQIEALDTDVAAIDADVATINTTLYLPATGLVDKVALNTFDIGALDGSLTTAEENITNLGTTTVNLDIKLNDVQQNVVSLGTTTVNLDENYNSLVVSLGVSFKDQFNLINTTLNYQTDRINNLAGVSVPNLNDKVSIMWGVSFPNINTSSSVIDAKLGNIIGVSIPQFLTRNETTLPNNFTNSSLTSLGTIGTLNVGGNLTVSGIGLFKNNLTVSGTFQSPITSLLSTSSSVIDGKISSQIGVSNVNLDNRINLLGTSSSVIDGKISNQIGVSNVNYDNRINLLGTSSSVIDGKIRSQIGVSNVNLDNRINLLGTSSSVIDGKISSQIGVSNVNLDNRINLLGTSSSSVIDGKVGTIIGVSIPQFLTRNETTLPNTFTSSSLTSLGTIKTSNIGGNENVSGNLNISGLLTTTGNGLFVNNLTISGILQSFQTSLLSTSSSVIDGRVGTIIGVSIPQFLTRNETVLPSSFTSSSLTSVGTLTNATISNLLTVSRIRTGAPSGDAAADRFSVFGGTNSNSYMSFNNTTYSGIESMVGLVNGDTQLRAPTNLTFFNNGTINTTINSSGNWNMNNNLTVSGTLQSFQTSLLNTSSSIIDAKLGTIIGVSIPQFLTRNETTLPNTFTNSSLTILGVLGNLSVSSYGNFTNNGGIGVKVKHTNNTNGIWFGMANSSDGQIITSNDLYFYTGGGVQTIHLNTSGDTIFNGNLTTIKSGVINSQSESVDSYLYISNSNGAGNALKTGYC